MQFTLARLPWAVQAGAGLGVSAVCAVCFHLVWASPAREDLAVQERALAKTHGDVTSAVTTLRRLPDARRAVGALAVRLQALAEESGLWISGFKPAPPATGEHMTEWSVAVEFDGTYVSLVAFLQRVG